MLRARTQERNGERGVTMLLVAIALVSMLGMCALAIDVITLYSAKSEAQRAADSAALAAAKMLVDMGVTTDPTATGQPRRRSMRPPRQLRVWPSMPPLRVGGSKRATCSP